MNHTTVKIADDAPARIHATLAVICAEAGLDNRDAELIKFTNNAVFRLPREQVVVRIAGSATVAGRVPKVIQVAKWLSAHAMPAVRLLGDITQPVNVDGQLATVWQLVPTSASDPTGADLGQILRRWHDLPAPHGKLPRWWPIDAIRRRLTEPSDLRPDDHEFLTRRCDQIEAELTQVRFELPSGPVWGDAFLGNIISGPSGPVACDFDSAASGPREWDLTPVAVGSLRFDYSVDAQALLASTYGFDVTTWSGFPVLRSVRELQLVTSVIPVLRSNPSLHDQWAYRLRTFKEGDTTARWTPYV
jgi:hypothetical protein